MVHQDQFPAQLLGYMNTSLRKLSRQAAPAMAFFALNFGSLCINANSPAFADLAGGWNNIESIRDNVVIFYSTSGNATIGNISASSGAVQTLRTHANLAGNWTHLARIRNGIVLFYSSTQGAATIVSFDESGNMNTLKSFPGFAGGWTHVTRVRDGSILFYNSATGQATVVTFDSSGNISYQQKL